MRVPARLQLDHCRAPGRGARSAAALALLACSLAGVLGLRYGDLRDAAQELEGQAARAALRSERQAARQRGGMTARAETARDVAAAHALGQPWEQFFGVLEACAGPDVGLLALDAGAGRAQLTGEARDLPALLGYLRRLGASPAFAAVDLQTHQLQQEDPQHPVRFVLLLTWRSKA
jgi:Tfp pilus assembly protein PilN